MGNILMTADIYRDKFAWFASIDTGNLSSAPESMPNLEANVKVFAPLTFSSLFCWRTKHKQTIKCIALLKSSFSVPVDCRWRREKVAPRKLATMERLVAR